jgi:predicted metal-dependent hydrolase
MRADGCAGALSERIELGRFLFVEPGGTRRVAVDSLRYFRPGFHPCDIDDGALLEAWKTSYVHQ